MSVKKTITFSDELYDKLATEATERNIPFNRLVVKRLQNKISNAKIIDAQKLTGELIKIYGVLSQNDSLTKNERKKVLEACRYCESFLLEATKKSH